MVAGPDPSNSAANQALAAAGLGDGQRPMALSCLIQRGAFFFALIAAVVDGLIDVGLPSAQQDVDQPDHLVRHRDDGFLVRLAHHQALVLGCQRALGHA